MRQHLFSPLTLRASIFYGLAHDQTASEGIDFQTWGVISPVYFPNMAGQMLG